VQQRETTPDDSVVDCWTSYSLSSEESRQRHANSPDLHSQTLCPSVSSLDWVLLSVY